jgi:MYXO-CTERM domain-containing protein
MRILLTSAALGALFAAAGSAHAYCRTTTAGVTPGYNPVVSGCITAGTPLAWRQMPVTFELNQAASTQVSLAEATPIFESSFAAWNQAACSATDATKHPSVSFQLLSPTTAAFIPCEAGDEPCEQAQADGPHQIVFRDTDWAYDDSANTIALTTVSYDIDTGEILASNMEINTFEHVISTADPPPDNAISLAAIATHEAGHFIGLAHSADTSAIMYAYYQPNAIALTPDDVAAVCAAYPPSTPSTKSGGCSLGPAAPPTSALVALGLSALALGGAARRRRRRYA